MANLLVKDAAGNTVQLKASGAGTLEDPYVPVHTGESIVEISVTPTLTVAGSYVTGDYVGTSATAMTFAGAARVNGGTGYIKSITLVDAGKLSLAGELWLFSSAPTPPADSAAWTISDADALKCFAVIPLSTYFATALNSVVFDHNTVPAFKCAAASKDIYGCFVARATGAYANGSLTFKLLVIQD